MSISAKNTAPEDEDFADIEFRPRPRKTSDSKPENKTPQEPVEDKAATSSASNEKNTTDSAPTDKEKAPDTDSSAKTEKSAPEGQANRQKDSGDKIAVAKPEPAAKADKKKSNWFSVCLDVLLVLILLLILVGGGYYIKMQMDLYRVPTSMEIALQENSRLQNQRDELVEAYYRADEQIIMRKSIDHLNTELQKLNAECAAIEASISEQKDRILASQHEIRTTDKEYRSMALSLLPGMAIGDATTTRGKSLRNAYIYRLEGKLITLRSPEGQIRIPVRELIKKELPKLARYAFGEIELVDMSDFDVNGEAPATAPAAERPANTTAPAAEPAPDYEPTGGTPVVDTSAGSTISVPETPQEAPTGTWDAPNGDLPF